jgi:hypothetical protein
MTELLMNEELLSLAEAARARIVPPARGGKRVHISTLLRWISKGAPGPDGQRVYLEALRVPRGWLTSRDAIHRFVERLTPRPGGDAPKPRTPAAR